MQMTWISFVLAVFPLALLMILLLWKRMSLLGVSAIAFSAVSVISFLYWKISIGAFSMAVGKGFFVALDILVIVLGAIFFLEMLRDLKVIDNISYYLESFSKDYRIHVIVLAWLFENFIEGTAGFGAPAAIVAPLLVGLGLSPLRAVIIGLLGNSASVVFGAAGAPIRVGFAGLDVSGVPLTAALINCVGFIVPIFMLWIMVSDRRDKKVEFMETLPFAIWSGVAFVVPSLLSVGLGQEFPSIIGSVIGLGLVVITTRLGIFVPKTIRRMHELGKPPESLSLLKASLPYIILIGLLVAGKLIIGSVSIKAPFGILHNIGLFNPGFAFMLAGLFIAVFWKSAKGVLGISWRVALRRAVTPFLVIVCMSSVAQVMISSGINSSGLPSSLMVMAEVFKTSALPFFAPFIGAFGSFLTGSATVSNIMFGGFLDAAGTALSMNVSVLLSLALVGAAAGNMVALADLLAAEAIVGLKGKEREIISGVLIPCLIYVSLVGIIGVFLT